MSFFYTTGTLHHVTPLPAGISYETAITAAHDHDRLMHADPEYVSHKQIPRDNLTKPFVAPTDSDTTRYSVTDHMAGMPKSLGLPQTIVFESEITNLEDGIDWVVKAPLGLLQYTSWRIVKRSEATGTSEQINDIVEDGGEWALVEDVKIEANRIVVAMVKKECESKWKGIQKKFVDHCLEIHNASQASA